MTPRYLRGRPAGKCQRPSRQPPPPPFRHFNDALLTEETTPLVPGDMAHKTYAAGIGLVADGELRLVQVEGR